MNRYKKITILVCASLTALSIAACGQAKEDEAINAMESSVDQPETVHRRLRIQILKRNIL